MGDGADVVTGGAEPREIGGGPFRLDEWVVDPSLNRLSRGDTTIQLELKVMDVLVCLAERAGEVLSRQEIVDRVWATEFISDNTLTHAITELRNALGDDARNPSFIETIHRRGYRLIAPVEPTVSDEAGESRVARFPVPERAARPENDRSPYPGLAAFTEADAEFFCGREAEVAQMWRKLTSRRLLAVIGPSGVGKSSFLRAGVIPAKPEGWGVLVCQPGEAPFAALARALVPEFAGDIEATAQLVDLRDGDRAVAMVSRWRDRHQQALFIVDQFEELYTLNPSEIQQCFSKFLRRLVDDGDVHVLLSMRDDFLYRCHAQDSLRPVFDGLLPLEQPGHEGLHRALVEPAQRLGFVFEDEGLPGEMISEVEGERGALPLLAFAVARLWEKRDRERRLLTTQAYTDIGGVGGALGRHAESTLKAVGDQRLPMVREIFRNLVTSEGTRSVRSIDEMLTVFPDSSRADAVQVLHRLVDARLLTSFEEERTEGHGRRRIEVVHETLLSSWPRLVRWQTQDADAAQLRDQLRQAARTWDEHDRTADFLWTGKAYREFSVWRENYPGGLTELEEDFASAMTTHAKRRRRRRRVAVATLIAVLVGGLAVVGSFWRRSVHETRRAEAQKLFALAQIELDNDRTASLAYTIKSLEMADDPEVRKLAVEALWRGPSKLIIDESPSWSIRFSPDGRRLVKSEESSEGLHLEVLSSDGARLELGPIHGNNRVNVNISPGGEFFTSWDWNIRPEPKTVALWSMSEPKPLATHKYEGAVRIHSTAWNERRLILLVIEDGVENFDALSEDGSHRRLGALTATGYKSWTMDSKTGRWLGAIQGDDVVVFEIRDTDLGEPRRLGRHLGVIRAEFHPRGDFLVTWSKDGEIRFWDPTGSSELKTLEAPGSFLAASLMGDGALLVAWMQHEGEEAATLWSLEGETPRLLRHYVGRTPDRGPWDPVGRRFPTSSRQGGPRPSAAFGATRGRADSDRRLQLVVRLSPARGLAVDNRF